MTEVQQNVVDIFVNWFGDERVDVTTDERVNITVWYPEADVTNERKDTIHIKDLYFRFVVAYDGILFGDPKAIRTTFTKSQFQAHYYHSHVNSASNYNFGGWCNICTGRSDFTSHITIIRNEYDATTWEFIPGDLDDFVKTESLNGGPWIRMESAYGKLTDTAITNDWLNYTSIPKHLDESTLHCIYKFIKYLVNYDENPIKLDKIGDQLVFHEQGTRLLNTLTRVFVEFIDMQDSEFKETHNETLKNMFRKVYLLNNKIYGASNENENVDASNIRCPLVFKGESKSFVIEGESCREYYILDLMIAKCIKNYIEALYYGIFPKNFKENKVLVYE